MVGVYTSSHPFSVVRDYIFCGLETLISGPARAIEHLKIDSEMNVVGICSVRVVDCWDIVCELFLDCSMNNTCTRKTLSVPKYAMKVSTTFI